MAETATPAWSLRGEFFENCNCRVTCPCLFSPGAPLSATPTEGTCEAGFAFHLDEGTFGDVPLAGLNVVLVTHIPGPMIEGNWTAALYVDERANERQQEALQAIFAGAAGGVLGSLAPLIGEVRGVKSVPITYRREGKRRTVEIPGIMQMVVRPVPSVMGEEQEIMATNAHPFAPEGVGMAVGEEGSTWSDYGLHWDNTGRNGHYAAINWSNQ